MNTRYQDLDLDGLLEVARSDAEHAGDMAEQARVLREMSADLDDKVDLMHGVMTTLFGAEGDAESGSWGGDSSRMMRTELDRLFTMASGAPQVFEDNAKSMDDFSRKAHDTLITIDQLHAESKEIGADSVTEQDGARRAREVMTTAGDDYLSSAQAMPQPEFYKGLRESDPDTSADWTADHGATPRSSRDPATVTDERTGPALQNPAPGPPAPASVAVSVPASSPAPHAPLGPIASGPLPAPVPLSAPGQQRGGFPLPRTGPTTPAVIGPRRPPGPPQPPAPRLVIPNTDGTVRPVIGFRPSAVTAPAAHPEARPDGTVRPVIGQRPAATGSAASRPYSLGSNGVVRPVIGGRGFGAAKAAPSTAPAATPGAATPPPHVNGTKDLLPTRYHNARPPGGMAFGSRPRPGSTAVSATHAKSPVDTQTTPRSSKPGQRRKPLPRQGGQAAENAITRGTNKRQSRRAGQDVFAKFDAARRPNSAPPAGQSEWELRQVVVPAVISSRKAH